MKPIGLLAWNDLRLTLRDRPAFIWMLAMPIALMWFFGSMDSGPSGPPRITLSVIDHDGGWLSEAFVEELTDERINLRWIPPAEAETATGKVRTLVIPEGFTAGVLAGEQQTLRLETEADSDEQFGLAAQAHLFRVIVRTLARLAEMDATGDAAESVAADEARAEFRRLGAREALVALEVSTAGQGRPVPSGMAQSVPGNLSFVVLMMTLIYGGVFLTMEKRGGMLRRQASLPLGRGRIFLGKLLGRLLLASLQIILLGLAGRFLFGLSWGSSPAGLALMLGSYAVAVAGLSTMLGALLRTPEQASSIGWILALVMAGLGGCWWPSEVMPRWLWNAAHVLPTAWAMDGFHALISFGQGLESVLLPAAALLGFGAVFTAVGARFLRFE